jgi:hypothetical protein
MVKRTWLVHPFLVALAPVCFLLQANVADVPIRDAFVPAGVVLALALVLLLPARLITRDWRKAAIVVSLFLLLFFSYGHVVSLLNGWAVGGVVIGRHRNFLVTDVLIMLIATFALTRTRRNLQGITAFLNVAAACFVAISVVRVAGFKLSEASPRPAGPGRPDDLETGSPGSITGPRPTIYYIILDAYGRQDVLSAFYGYDNSSFIDALKRRGFYVAAKARSNYAYTPLSTTSSLNAMYLDEVAKEVGENTWGDTPLRPLIRDSRVVRALRQHGYRFVVIASGCGFTEIKDADLYLSLGRSLDEFHTLLLDATPLPVIINQLFPKAERPYGYDLHRRRILYAFDTMPRLARQATPSFIFAHIVAPHMPFVFGEHGEPVTPEGPYRTSMPPEERAIRSNYVEPYARQLVFLNTKVLETIDAILANSSSPPIIIIQGDHGPASTLHNDDATKTNMWERMSILNAYYFPDQDYTALYESITPVNTFRVILNQYFGAKLELLDDESFFSPKPRLYKFINVTEAAVSDGWVKGADE